jgi:putative membrane protein
MLDTTLAIAHHILFLGLVSMVSWELALMRPGLSAGDLKRLAGVDAGYGLAALFLVGFGVARVLWAAKGPDYYAGNHWFWAKMAAFALVGLLSIPPTLAILRWRKAARADAGALPSPAEIRRVRPYLLAELALLLATASLAAVMARWTTEG